MTGSAGLLAKLTRYAAVSAISTSVTLSLLGVMIYTKTLSAGWANIVATAVGTVPSFELNRRWVWAKSGRRSVMKEVVPFCTLSFSELALSTVAVSLAARWSAASGLGNTAVTLISLAANVFTFGALWALQYVLLDRALFGRRSGQQAGAEIAVDGLAAPELIELEDAA
jgi:putative flippase GtrA